MGVGSGLSENSAKNKVLSVSSALCNNPEIYICVTVLCILLGGNWLNFKSNKFEIFKIMQYNLDTKSCRGVECIWGGG